MKINIMQNEDGTSSVICPNCGAKVNIGVYDKEDTHGELHSIVCEECLDSNSKSSTCFNSYIYWDKEGNLFSHDDVRVCDFCGKSYLESSDKIIIEGDSEYYCSECHQEIYNTCEKCGCDLSHVSSEMFYDELLCEKCYVEEKNNYKNELLHEENKKSFLRICNGAFHKDIMNYCCELEKHSIMTHQQTYEIAKNEYNEKFIKIFDEYYKTAK